MKVRVKLFAVARELSGCDTLEIALADSATVGNLRQALAEQAPQLAGIVRQLMFAVNAEYAGDNTLLHDGADVACIPPVSGG